MDLRLEKNYKVCSFKQFIFFATLVIIFAFSNIRALSIMFQFIFVSIIALETLKTRKIKLSIHFFWMSLFIIWGIFVSVFAIDSTLSFITVINLAFKLLLYTSVIIYIDSGYKFRKTLQYLIIAASILIIRLLLVTPYSAWGTERLGESIDLNANIIGLVLGYASIITTYLAKRTKNKLYYLLLVPFIIVSLFTGSRKAFLLIIIGISLILMLEVKQKRSFIINLFLILLLGIGIYYLVMNNELLYNIIGQRLKGFGLFSGEMNASTNTRITMIKEGLMFFKERPIFGYGFENFRLLSGYGTYSHNNFIEITVSSGIIGLIIYYSLPIFLLFSSLSKVIKNKNFSIIIVLLTIVLIMDFGLVSYSQLITQTIVAICVSYYLILSKNKDLIIPEY